MQLTVDQAIAELDGFIKSKGGLPHEWYVGLTHDPNASLASHGMEASDATCSVELVDKQAAEAVRSRLLQHGLAEDDDNATPRTPPTQVYLFRAPGISRFRALLRNGDTAAKQAQKRKARVKEWGEAVNRLAERLQQWLGAVDREGVLAVEKLRYERAEEGLGQYTLFGLTLQLADSVVQIIPVGRNVVGSVHSIAVEGRVDVSNGVRKYILLRTLQGGEKWWAHGQDYVIHPLDQDRFLGIVEDLLS